MIKKIALVSSLLIAFSAPAMAGSYAKGCQAKQQNIQRQLEYARAHGNASRVAGLQRALADVNRYCVNKGPQINKQGKNKARYYKDNNRHNHRNHQHSQRLR